MAQVLFRLGDVLNAQRFLLRALDLGPGLLPRPTCTWAWYTACRARSAQARAAFQQAITLSPNTPTADQASRFLAEVSPP